jgi:intein/homing endonuclease
MALNMPEILAGKDIKDLPRFDGQPCLIIGAGPSIRQFRQLEVLAKSGWKNPIICSDRMLIQLLKRKIKPDIVVTVDGESVVQKFYRHPLVEKFKGEVKAALCASTVHPDVLKHCPLEKYFFIALWDNPLNPTSLTRAFHLMTQKTMLETYGNAGSCAFSIAYYLGCLKPSERIVINAETKSIKTVIDGDCTLTHKGRFRKIQAVLSRSYNGEIIEVTPHYFRFKVSLTPEHPVLGIRGERCHLRSQNNVRCFPKRSENCKHCKRRFYNNYQAQWIPAKELTRFDYVLYPIQRETSDIEYLFLKDYNPDCIVQGEYIFSKYSRSHSPYMLQVKSNLRRGELNQMEFNATFNKIRIDKDFLRFCGYYLAEGYVGKNHEITLAFGGREEAFAEDVIRIVLKIFGIKARTLRFKNKIYVYFCSKVVSNLIRRLFGGTAPHKRVPAWMLHLPLEKQVQLIKGLFYGDAHKCKSSRVIKYSTASEVLAHQVRDILLRFDIIPAFGKQERREGGNPKYVIEISGNFAKMLNDLISMGKFKPIKGSGFNRAWIEGNYAVIPIRKVETKKYKGTVYNLCVDDDNSYTTMSFAVHNCNPIGLVGLDYSYYTNDVRKTTYYESLKALSGGDTAKLLSFYKRTRTWAGYEVLTDIYWLTYLEMFLPALEKAKADIYNLSPLSIITSQKVKGTDLRGFLRSFS